MDDISRSNFLYSCHTTIVKSLAGPLELGKAQS